MTESIRGDIITKARADRGDVRIIQSERGGISLATFTYLDVLTENDIITNAQADYGRSYMTVKATAFHDLQIKTSHSEYRTPDEEEPTQEMEDRAEQGAATEIFLSLCRRLKQHQKKAIEASCGAVDGPAFANRMAIVWAFGENTLRDAFETLERVYDPAKEEAEEKMRVEAQRACNRL